MKNLKILNEQSLNQSYIDTNGPLKESSIQLMNIPNNDDKSLCEARDLNNKIIALEAENTTLKVCLKKTMLCCILCFFLVFSGFSHNVCIL